MGRIIEILKMTFVGLVFGAFLLFCGDWVVLLVKIHTHGNAFGTVHVYHMVSAGLNSGKTEFFPGNYEDDPCVHSIFPHQGDPTCWYLEKHKEQIDSY